MTILSLSQGHARTSRRYDVVVIGAGIAGTIAACEIAKRGQRVALIESGSLTQTDETHRLNQVVQLGDEYRGAANGRFRCLGGTSTRWGGALIPFRDDNLASSASLEGAHWPISMDSLGKYVPAAEKLFRLPPGPYDLDLVSHLAPVQVQPSQEFALRSAKWPAFANRNVATLFGDDLRSENGPDVYLDCTVVNLELSDSGFAHAASVRDATGVDREFSATTFIIAAGAIETTRLALLVDTRHGGQLFGRCPFVGKYLQDHLSAPAATLMVRDQAAVDRLASFRFARGGMRNFRFEPTMADATRAPCIGGFIHLSYRAPPDGGFDALREIYRSLQRRRAPSSRSLSLLLQNSGWFARAALARVLERRVLPPDRA